MSNKKAKGQATSLKGDRRDKKTATRASNPGEQISKANRKFRRLPLQKVKINNENIPSSVTLSPIEEEKYPEPPIIIQESATSKRNLEIDLDVKHKVKSHKYIYNKRSHTYSPKYKRTKQKYDTPSYSILDDDEIDSIIYPDSKNDKKKVFDPISFRKAMEVMHYDDLQISDAIDIIQGGVDADYYLKPIVDNHLKQLLKDTQNINDFPQHKQRHVLQYYLTPPKIDLFRNVYPHLLLVPSNNQKHSDTPLLSDLTEQFYDDIIDYCKVQGYDSNYMFVDVRSKNYYVDSQYLWNCKPILDASDVCHSVETINQRNCCTHQAIDCTCVVPDVYISIDTLYEFSAHDIAMLVMKSKQCTLLAAHHVFHSAFGSVMGELNYIVEDDQVKCTVNRKTTYKSNLHWMHTEAYHFNTLGLNHTLTWKTIKTYQSSQITLFTVHVGHLPYENQAFTNIFTPSLQNEHYYGGVNLSAGLNDNVLKNMVGEQFTVDTLKMFSWGSYAIMFNTKTQEKYYAPKQLISHMSLYCMGKVRNQDSFKNALGHARIAAKNYNIPPLLLEDSLFAATCLGFVDKVEKETKLLHSIVKPIENLMDIHSKAMTFNFQPTVSYRTAAIMAAIMSGTAKITGLALTALGITTCVTPLALTTIACGTAAIIATYKHSTNKNLSVIHPFSRYRYNFASNNVEYRSQSIPLTTLPGRPIELEASDLDNIKIDRTAKIQYGDLSLVGSTKDPITVASIVSTYSPPIVLQNSAVASAASIMKRPLTPQLVHTIEFDFELFNEFYLYCIKYFDEFLPNVLELRPKKFKLWNSKFTLAQQKLHLKALYDFNAAPSERINTCGSFPKIESVIKTTFDGAIPYDPRNIASRDPQHNTVTAPFIHSMSDLLAKIWCIKEEFGLVYTSGVPADQIGDYFYKAIQGINRVVKEGDFRRFDTTIHVGFLILERDYYALCGAAEVVLESLTRSINTVAYDKFGTKFSVDGVRHSGDPNTSTGNTLIQGLSSTFCLAKTLDPVNPPSPVKVWNILELYALYLGDDSNLIMNDKICTVTYTKYLRKLGLQLEPKSFVNDEVKYYSTFCSARFVPVRRCSDNSLTMILTKPLGRLFAKVGYYVNIPPKLDPNALVKGDALSSIQDCHCIPFSSHYWNHIIKILSNVQATQHGYLQKELQYKHHVVEKYWCSPETWEFMFEVYHLTRLDLDYFAQELLKIRKLPHVLDLPIFHYAMVMDGMCEDTEHLLENIGHVEIEPCDMTEVPKDTFIEQAKKYCPILLTNTHIEVQNNINLDEIGL